MDLRFLVDVNATLNATAFVLTVSGLVAIKCHKEDIHKRLMLSAATVSALFFASYLTYHLTCEPVRFGGEGAVRIVYLVILVSHVILAVVLAPLLVTTVILGLRDRRPKHRRFARITAPIWVYVSITGVVVYFMLYHW
jgi:putative membrane protein